MHVKVRNRLFSYAALLLEQSNCSEPASKTLRLSSVWRIRQIDSYDSRLVNAGIRRLLSYESAWFRTNVIYLK